MKKFINFIALLIVLGTVDAEMIRQKRQLYGRPYIGPINPIYVPEMMGGYGLTPDQAIANRNLAIAQAQGRQAILTSQIATNRAVQQARLNANILAAQTRANLAAANANALMIGRK